MDTLGWIYYQKGLYGSAIKELLGSLEKIPENPVVHYHLGLAYFKHGKPADARAELEIALGLDPQFDGSEDARKVLSGIGG